MCGIIGYVGSREPFSLLIDGLKCLEYRGYDSCGIAVLDNGTPQVMRSVGRVAGLEQLAQHRTPHPPGAACGIGHTRWATHGRPTENNAHPHCDCSGHFLVAHNGIIENYAELRQQLSREGHCFRSETDTEVLPHLIERHFRGNLEEAVQATLREVEGAYGLVAVCTHDHAKIVAARRGAPLVLGLGEGENFVASDTLPLLPYTREMMFLDDAEVAVIRPNSIEVRNTQGHDVPQRPQTVTWNAEMASKEGYPHFMLKEIFEQPRAVHDTLRGRLDSTLGVKLEDELEHVELLRSAERLHIVACGTSWHAAQVGRFMIEELAGIPVDVDYASEFRYRNPRLGPRDVVVAISQSGETADTLAAMNEAKRKGAHVLTICNVVGSTAARQSDNVLYTRAGPEIGVASTKAFTTQLTVLYLLGLFMARLRETLPAEEIGRQVEALRQLPGQMGKVLEQKDSLEEIARHLFQHKNFLYLGRGTCYPIALEGALKLKEISYIHAEGYPAGEMKHGPIALIDSEMPVVVLAPQNAVYAKTLANMEEVKGRDGILVAVATEGDTQIPQRADYTVFLPKADSALDPILAVLPLQLLAYYAAVLRGCDVDKPRNLAKSVTVE